MSDTTPPRKPLQVWMTDAEREAINAAAKAAGLPVSTWMRVQALKAARPK